MMLTPEQEKLIHPAVVKFAIEHYQDVAYPKGSVILIAAEEFADANSQIGPNQLMIHSFRRLTKFFECSEMNHLLA